MLLNAGSNKVTYVGSGVYVMGSLSCAICGHLFPLTTSPHDICSCENCGAKHSPYELVHTNNYYKRCRSQNDANNKNMSNESVLGALHSTLQFSSSEINEAQWRVRLLLGQNTPHESETNLPFTSEKVSHPTLSSLPHRKEQQKMKKDKDFIIEHANNSTSTSVTEAADVASNTSNRAADKHKRKSLVKTKEDKQEQRQEETVHATLSTATHASSGSKFTNTLKRAKVGTIAVDHRVIEEAFCENCHTHRPCWTFSRQTRSADEGQTIFFQCTKCLSEWQQNS